MKKNELELLTDMKKLEELMLLVSGQMYHYQNDDDLQLAGRVNKKSVEMTGAAIILREWIDEIEKELR